MSLTNVRISLARLLVLSAIIRVGLIKYSEWHDLRSTVKYTDVDYRVFTDAARFMLNPNVSSFEGLGNNAPNSAAGIIGGWVPVGKYV